MHPPPQIDRLGTRRVLAGLVDYGFIAAWLALLGLAGAAGRRARPWPGPALLRRGRRVLLPALSSLPATLWLAVWEASARQASPGKALLGLRVQATNGDRPTMLQTLARNALKLAPWEIAHQTLLGIDGWPQDPRAPHGAEVVALAGSQVGAAAGVVAAVRGRGPHDVVAGTVVTPRPVEDTPGHSAAET